MALNFINKNGSLDENRLEKYVNMKLNCTLTNCDFKDVFIAPIMAEIADLVNSGKFNETGLQLRIKKIFRLYGDNCNCSRDELVKKGVESLNQYFISPEEIKQMVEDSLSDFLYDIADNTSKYDVNKGSLMNYYGYGLKNFYAKDYMNERSRFAYSLNDIVLDEEEEVMVEKGDCVKSEGLNPDEVCEEAEAKSIAMEIVEKIWEDPKIMTKTAREVFMTFYHECVKKPHVDYKDIDVILGKKSGTTSKNFSDFGARVRLYLEENNYDYDVNLIMDCFNEFMYNIIKTPFPGKRKKKKQKKTK